MPKNDNRLPSVTKGNSNRLGQSVVRNMISQKLGELDKERNEEAFIVLLEDIVLNPKQPRQIRDEERDQELTADIKARGVLEPILVRPHADGKYQIIAGERRYRAAVDAGLEKIPVIVKDYDDEQARYASLVENLQRQDLHELDEARFFQTLIDNYNVSVRDIADYIHRSHTYVQTRLTLLKKQDNSDTSEDANLDGNDSEKSNKRNEKLQKLKKSQSKAFVISRPITRFNSFLNEARTLLPQFDDQKKKELADQIKELKQQIEELEKELKK